MRFNLPLLIFNVLVPAGLIAIAFILVSNVGNEQDTNVDTQCRAIGMVDLRSSLVVDWGRQQAMPLLKKLNALYVMTRETGTICHSAGLTDWRQNEWSMLGFNDTSLEIEECSEHRQNLAIALLTGSSLLPTTDPGRLFGDLHVCYAYRHLELLKLKAKLVTLAVIGSIWLVSVILRASKA